MPIPMPGGKGGSTLLAIGFAYFRQPPRGLATALAPIKVLSMF